MSGTSKEGMDWPAADKYNLIPSLLKFNRNEFNIRYLSKEQAEILDVTGTVLGT